ncbi:hypothetical protein CHL78_002705 [Romboutsia weinsteinii]|uniref:Uncharacterized protein n=1 Tax=Romboutsia weinsteinii TaxID=2020949 RepID=A0A371J925_9FIRM|nr:hypothetical protein [Romboutsia weinsteinii]RDY29235.1 hypothetical protein CHL78_002705 [Romboutsia weinsteinii]
MFLKKIKKSVALALTVITVSIPFASTASALEPEVYMDSQGNEIERVYVNEESDNTEGVENKGVGTPAFYEYSKKVGTMGVKELDKLKGLADKAHKSSSQATLFSYASFITSFYWPAVSTGLAVASMLPTSYIKPYETVSYCYDRLSYLYKNPSYKKAKGEIQFVRFWNGNSYRNPWQPYKAPRHISYVK